MINISSSRFLIVSLIAIVKLFNVNPKRLPDASHKKQILESAPVLADVMLQHLSFSDQGKLSP